MEKLSKDGKYEITDEMREKLTDFFGGYASEEETFETIKNLFDKTGYLIDTHTAVASCVYNKYVKETGDKTVSVIASTASPYKFTRSVINALGIAEEGKDDFELADKLSEVSKVEIPEAVTSIRTADVLHKTVVDKTEMEKAVRNFLSL
jgi:threonine synthase